MRTLIYGLGKEALFVRQALADKGQFLGFTDGEAKISRYAGAPYVPLPKAAQTGFDYILLALNDRRKSDEVRRKLAEEFGIEENRILDFFALFAEEKTDRVLKAHHRPCDGLILGISHAMLGINPQYLDGVWYNLANGSEDIYYHYRALQKCRESYPQAVCRLRYAVIELYDYPVFNFDTSLSAQALFYWSHGGVISDLHHYAQNKNFTRSVSEEMRQRGYYCPYTGREKTEKDELRKTLFDEAFVYRNLQFLMLRREAVYLGYNDYPLVEQMDRSIESQCMLPFNLHYMGEQLFPETVRENATYFYKTIHLLKEINPQMKILLCLLPRYYRMEEIHQYFQAQWKKQFMAIIGEVVDNRTVFFKNYKALSEISTNSFFYKDTAHLNYWGGIAFTEILREELQRL